MMVPIYFNLHHDLTSPLVCPFFASSRIHRGSYDHV